MDEAERRSRGDSGSRIKLKERLTNGHQSCAASAVESDEPGERSKHKGQLCFSTEVKHDADHESQPHKHGGTLPVCRSHPCLVGHLLGVAVAAAKGEYHQKTTLRPAQSLQGPRAKDPTASTPSQSPAKDAPKATETKPGGKGAGEGKKGKPEKRHQQCIPFFRKNCKKGAYCNYEHQVAADGRPVQVGPENLKGYDEAVK